MESSSKFAAHRFLDRLVASPSFGGKFPNDCIALEPYLEGSDLDGQALKLLNLSNVPVGRHVNFRSQGFVSVAREEMETCIQSYFAQKLLIVNEGDEILIAVKGSDFKVQVSHIDPEGCCLVTSETRIHILYEGPVLAAATPKPVAVQATSSPDKCADVMVDIAAALNCLMFSLQGSLW
jgi:hypothetical protein